MISRLQEMIPGSIQPWVVPTYRTIRRRLNQLDRAIDRRTLSETAFIALLREIGFTNGATVLVHSSMDDISRRVPSMTAARVIKVLQELVGPEGTIVMPTFPFRGKQLHYVEKGQAFDVLRTPSQVGLITEVFRRLPGVGRSLHPTHPFAAWGKHAEDLLSTHDLGGTFGENSPIFRLQDYNGLVVGLGTGLRDSFTILHVAEECHPKARRYFFEDTPRTTVVVGKQKNEIVFRFPVLRDNVVRNYNRVENALIQQGVLRYVTRSGFRCAVTTAQRFIAASMKLVDQDRYL
jgi:aminoglycoside 3-N-acetyltransferase